MNPVSSTSGAGSGPLPANSPESDHLSDPVIHPLKRPGRWIAATVVLLLAICIIGSLVRNPRVEWSVVSHYLFAPLTLRGLVVTLYLTVLAMIIGIVGGTLVAVMRLSDNFVLRWCGLAYVWFFRGTPVLVQIIFWGYMGALYPNLVLGIPFTHVVFASGDTSRLISATVAAILALGLNEIAYASEIVRAGISSVDPGQREAATALGMSSTQTMRRIVLPQAMRAIVPPMGNETIGMLKTTSLVSVIAGHDLLTNLQTVYAQNFEVIPLLIVASIWYLAITSVLTVIQGQLEKKYGRGVNSRGHERRKERRTIRGMLGVAR
jgi:polar amino acid transport system permease protein